MNILYITVDALRADHVTEEIMPNMYNFVDQGCEYTRCYANGPGTPWSFPALLGGRYSAASDGFGIPGEDDPRPTLAEVLRDEGYATAGFTDNRFASSDYNYDRGIDSMFDGSATSSEKRLKQEVRERLDHDGILYQTLLRSYHIIDDLLVNIRGSDTRFARAELLIDELVEWVADQDDEWFAWLHPMDTHAPYEAPDDYQQLFLDDPVPRRRSQELARKATHHPKELTDEDWDLQRKLYKAECKYLDDQLGQLLNSQFESSETLIVFTADHGEMHGEHGLGGHPQQFWEEVIHVPCGMSSPRLEGNTINKQIAHIDLPATMLDLIGIQQPSGWPGRSLPPSKKDEWEAREHVFVDVEPELNRDHAGVRRADNWKLMRHDDDGELLLDVNTNPEEDPTGDKTDSATERYEVLSTVLDDHLDDMEQQRRGEMAGIEDEEMVEQHLKELGYLE